MRQISILAAAALLLAACAKPETPATDSAAPAATPTADANVKAAMVSNAIKANPAAADSILKANGYTAESFERELFDIAADSTRSAAYAAARTP